MNEEDITFDSLPDESQLNSAGEQNTVGNVADNGNAQPEAMTLSELNQFLGKNFTDKATALKALKDTFSYVGKKKEDIESEVKAKIAGDNSKTDALARELEEMRKERFYDKNPQYAEPSVRKLIERIGGNPSEVVNSEEFKTIFTKVADYDKSQNLRTVLESNPRLASSRDSFSKARDILSKSQNLSADKAIVDELATNAVMDAYGM